MLLFLKFTSCSKFYYYLLFLVYCPCKRYRYACSVSYVFHLKILFAVELTNQKYTVSVVIQEVRYKIYQFLQIFYAIICNRQYMQVTT